MKLFGNERTKQLLIKELASDPYLLRRIPSNSMGFFIDIGAQAGLVSVIFRLSNNKTQMFAVEPDPVAYAMLKDNVADLGVITLNKALGDGSDFALNPPEKRTTLGVEYVKAEAGMPNVIKSARLTDLIMELNKHSLVDIKVEETMFKIDCEGGEAHIMNHPESVDILKKAKAIAFEIHRGIFELMDYYNMFDKIFAGTHTVIKTREHENRSANFLVVRKDVRLAKQ